MRKFMMLVMFAAFASYANAADVVKKELVERTTTEKVVASSTTPVVAKKATPKKKIGGKKKVKKVVVATPVAPMTISPTASAVTEVSPTAKAVSVTPITVTKTAKKSFKFQFSLFSVFMPDQVTTTSRCDHFQVAYGVRAFNGTDTSGQNPGWQTSSSDMTGVDGDLAILAKVWRTGVEYRPLGHTSKHVTKFNGSGMGDLDVTTSNVILGKFFVVDEKKWSVSLGYGAEQTTINGSIRMGGFKFSTSGDGWSPVLQLGAEYHLNKNWSIGSVYERSNIRLVTTIPGAPDLVTTRTDRVLVRLNVGLL